ncbi:MAG: thiamine ABC transporter substrate-binding protein [Acidimicrobiia bacterium]|nr:thiamine ABC transporter substrate-binding protein [Acidimicrobiia bacterium]
MSTSTVPINQGTATRPVTLTLLTHDSFLVSEGILDTFKLETGIEVEVLQAGDAGAVVNQAILTRDNPLADVLYGVDNTFLRRARDAGMFDPYTSDAAPLRPELFADGVTPIDFGDVCLNYRIKALEERGLEPPSSLDDLLRPEYAGTLVVQNPLTSSPGLAFLLATIDTFGEDGWQDYWRGLFDNDVSVTSGWDEAYNGPFATGERPIVVSYASSPPAEVLFAETPTTTAPTGVVTAGCYRQIEYAGVLAGTEHPSEARQLIDFMVSRIFQEDIPLNMFVFPANAEAELPAAFLEYTQLPDSPSMIPPDTVEANREVWLEAWNELFAA